MQVDRIQRLIHSDNIDDIYLGYILINDDEEFAKILLQKRNDLSILYVSYNDCVIRYTMTVGFLEREHSNKPLFIEIAMGLVKDTKVYMNPFDRAMIINGKK